jgi:hypothetical protein
MRFIEAGGDVVLLSKILGYSTISRTYNGDRHPSNDAMFAAVENMINFPAQHKRQGEKLTTYPSASYSRCDN